MSESRQGFKSALLEKLGVKSAVVIEAGQASKKLAAALAITVVSSLGGLAHADQAQEQNADRGFMYGFKAGLGLSDDDAPNPEEVSPTRQAMSVALAGVAATAASPIMATYIVGSSINDTYEYIERREEIQTEQKLKEVELRIAKVKEAERQRIVSEERARRAAQPEGVRLADQLRMTKMAIRTFREMDVATPELSNRLEQEQEVERNGGETEVWYKEYMAEFDRMASPEFEESDSLALSIQNVTKAMKTEAPKVNTVNINDILGAPGKVKESRHETSVDLR